MSHRPAYPFVPTLIAAALAAAFSSPLLAAPPPLAPSALPTGAQLVAGQATVAQNGARMDITQASNRAILDWQSFNIGANAQVNFAQPSAAAVALNRVVGQDPSQILGRLTANGQVFLVNPNGIYFGRNAQVDVAGLVASTHNIRNDDFMAGRYVFNLPGKPGASVINEGTIRIADTGIAAFVAPSVANRGIIAARLGKVALAAANGFTLDFTGDQLLSFLVSDEVAKTAFDLEGQPLTSFVENSGHIEAQGGYVLLTAKAAEGVVQGVINQSGSIEATSVGTHKGEIILNAGKGGLTVSGILDASAPEGGDGGFIETSGGTVNIDDATRITTNALYGKTGNWLIDPNNYTIAAAGGNITGTALSNNLAHNNVTIQTATMGTPGGNGDIFVNAPVFWTANTQLTLQAQRDVRINSNITATGSGSDLLVNIPGTVYVFGNVAAGRVRYWVNGAILAGSTTSSSQGISISPYSASTPVRIENSPTANTLALTPNEIGTLHAPSGGNIYIGFADASNDLTVTAPLNNNYISAQNWLTLAGRNVSVDAPITLTATNSHLEVQASGTLAVNANVTGTGLGGDGGDAVRYRANSIALNAMTTAIAGTPSIQTYDTNRSIRIESTPTAGVLSLNPSEFATLHADGDRDVVLLTQGGDITFAAALASYQLNSGYFNVKAPGGNITVNAAIDGSNLAGMQFLAGQDITFNAPVTNSNLTLTAGGVITQYRHSPSNATVVRQSADYFNNLVPQSNVNQVFSASANRNSIVIAGYDSPAAFVWNAESRKQAISVMRSLVDLGVPWKEAEDIAKDAVASAKSRVPNVEGLARAYFRKQNGSGSSTVQLGTASRPGAGSSQAQLLVLQHQNDSTNQMLLAIADGQFTNSNMDPVWTGLYRNGTATAVQREVNRLRNVYDAYTQLDIFSLIIAGQLNNDPNNSDWRAIYRDGHATAAQVQANDLKVIYDRYSRLRNSQEDLFRGLLAGNFDHNPGNASDYLNDPVWKALYTNGSPTGAQFAAASSYETYLKFRGRSADSLAYALAHGDLTYGDMVWQALPSEARTKAYDIYLQARQVQQTQQAQQDQEGNALALAQYNVIHCGFAGF